MKKNDSLNMLIEGDLKKEAQEIAENQGRSLASYVRFSIREQVKRDKRLKMSVNVTLKELEECVSFAKERGISEHKAITLHHDTSGSIGNALAVSADYEGERRDVTNYKSF